MMNEHEKKVRKLKKGDIIRWSNDEKNVVIDTIIFDNTKEDIRAFQGNRVTINGLHWYITEYDAEYAKIYDKSKIWVC